MFPCGPYRLIASAWWSSACSSLGALVVCSSTGQKCRSRIRSRCTPLHFLPFGEVFPCCGDSCIPVFGARCRRQLWRRTQPQVHRRGRLSRVCRAALPEGCARISMYSPRMSHLTISIRSTRGTATVMSYWCRDSPASYLFLSR